MALKSDFNPESEDYKIFTEKFIRAIDLGTKKVSSKRLVHWLWFN